MSACTNTPPVITGLSAGADTVVVGGTVELACEASDPEDDTLDYIWSSDDGTIVASGSSAVWNAPDKTGSYTVGVTVRDSRGNETDGTISIEVTGNLAPRIESLLLDPSSIGEGQLCSIRCVAADPEGGQLSYQWESGSGVLVGTGPEISWTAPYGITESWVRVIVSDTQGESAASSITIGILPNHPPEIESLVAEPRIMTPGTESIIVCLASDANGDVLAYNWEATGGTLRGSGNEIIWTAPEETGTYYVTVTVTDGRNGEAVKKQVLKVSETCG